MEQIDLSGCSDFFITSDTFFGRSAIINIANRPFSSVDEMNETLIKNWNKVVKKDDTIVHLGNFAWDPIIAKKVIRKLNGNIILIEGSDDSAMLDVYEAFNNITIPTSAIIYSSDMSSVFCHWPLMQWKGKGSGVIHFHGNTVYSHKSDFGVSPRINVCTDFWNYSPIRYSAIKEFIEHEQEK